MHEKREIEVSAGDKLLLEANRWETKLRVTNGELVTVARVDQGRIELADGRTLPANYRTFDHGYAVTAHRSQGQTVDAVIVSGDRMSKELFYVAATRGRESLTVITSDKEQLREAIGISGERTSATELARKAEQQTQPGAAAAGAALRAQSRNGGGFCVVAIGFAGRRRAAETRSSHSAGNRAGVTAAAGRETGNGDRSWLQHRLLVGPGG